MLRAVLIHWRDTLAHADEDEGLRLASTTTALLEALRGRRLCVAVVAGEAERADVERLGVAALADAVAASPQAALAALSVAPGETLAVAGHLDDVRADAAAGMATAQAFWFRADEDPGDFRPDHEAFTQMDVLNVARRLGAPD